MTVGFLLGAGFSRAMHSSMPLVKDLLEQIHIPDDVPVSLRGDLEQILSYLWTNYPWNTEKQHLKNRYQFLELNEQIYSKITKAENDAWSDLHKNDPRRVTSNNRNANSQPIWQARLAGLFNDTERFFAITMNYDTLFERLMMMYNELNLIYPAPLQSLDEIWNQRSTRKTELDSVSTFFNEFHGEQYPLLYKLHGSVSWYSLDPLDVNAPIYCEEMNKFYALGDANGTSEIHDTLTSIIVPPVADKTFLYSNKVLRSQWIGASRSLLECHTLYCVGYSFPQSDLATQLFLGQACANIKKVVMVNLKDDGGWDRIREMFPEDVQLKWITGTDCVEKMALELFKEDDDYQKYQKEEFETMSFYGTRNPAYDDDPLP